MGLFRSRKKHRPKKKEKRHKLSGEALRIIDYWYSALRESERERVDEGNIRGKSIIVHPEELLKGTSGIHAHKALTAKLAKDEDFNLKPDGSLDVAVCPIGFKRSNDSDYIARYIHPIWIPAKLDSNGGLTPIADTLPWIPRELLEPSITTQNPLIGDIEDLANFQSSSESNVNYSWSGALSLADEMLKAVTGSKLSNLEIEEYQRIDQGIIVAHDLDSGGNNSIPKLLLRIRDGRLSVPLLKKFTRTSKVSKSPLHKSKITTFYGAKHHNGQFGGGFQLNPSQRHAVHRALTLPENDFLCVVGPPGTGKTTLLQSIIASVIVESALKKAVSPPIIACTGATNQSVQNIIDCFARNSLDDDILATRWLPEVVSYGSFCISRTRSEQIERGRYHQELMQGPSFSKVMHGERYFDRAEKFFLAKAKNYFGREISIKSATQELYQRLHHQHHRFNRDLQTISGVGLVYWFKTLIGREIPIPEKSFEEALPSLDQENRYQMFLLAARYWEGMWLLGYKAYKKKLDLEYSSNHYLPTTREHWQRRAMITPAFVATLSMLPRFFYRHGPNPPTSIDYLIFDEAGQIPPEKGVTLLSLTKRAIVVGDCQQLPPHNELTAPLDRRLAVKSKLLSKRDSDKDWIKLEELGLTASSGSLMKLAQSCTRSLDYGREGTFLNEQRRSVPPIVDFANELAYGEELYTVRKKSNSFLPPFYLFEVKGEATQTGQSKLNYSEVDAIASFIETYHDRLLLDYKTSDISDVIAVITSHLPQARELKRKLSERYPGMIIGTVHSLQGAERPVILFSSVYGEGYNGSYFFDQSTNILNVAVTRAKDSFIAFGNRKVFNPSGDRPSSILARFLLRDFGVRLELNKKVPIEPKLEGRIKIPLLNNLPSTLAEHQLILSELLKQAQHWVMIVSPTISAGAIKSDDLVNQITRTVNRGIRVDILADFQLTSEGDKTQVSQEGLELLRSTGANVYIVDQIHAKMMGADDEVYLTGSFNWLSANRNERSKFKKFEQSAIFFGDDAKEPCRDLKIIAKQMIEQAGRLQQE